MTAESELIPSPSGRRTAWAEYALAAIVTLVGLGLAISLTLQSDGFYHDDDITHYYFAVQGWSDGQALWHQWARPGYNVPTAFVAHFWGLAGARLFSALQTAAVGYLSFLIARRLLRKAHMPTWAACVAPALVWLQPLTMKLAMTTLTETPAALYLTAAVWLLLRGNFIFSSVVLSLTFVTRTETLALAPLFAAGLAWAAYERSGRDVAKAARTPWLWCSLAAMLWAPLVWVICSIIYKPEESIVNMFGRPYTDEYGRGEWTHFLLCWLQQAGAGVLGLAAAGAIVLGRRALLIIAVTAGLVGLHTWLFYRGSFASGGYGRFLVPLSGLVAVLGSAAVAEAWRRRGRGGLEVALLVPAAALLIAPRYVGYLLPWDKAIQYSIACMAVAAAVSLLRRTRWAVVGGTLAVSVALAVAGIQARQQVTPLLLSDVPYNYAVGQVVEQVKSQNLPAQGSLSSHVLTPLLLPGCQMARSPQDAQARWEAAAPGTVFIWDYKYGGKADQDHPISPLYTSLQRYGRQVGRYWDEWSGVEAYVREATPPQARLEAMGNATAATRPGQ